MEQFTRQQKQRLTFLTALLIIVFSWGLILNPFSSFYSENTGILRVGAFSDSPWDESNGFAHVILNKAIEEFEAENPGVRVVYESGIRKQDYSEWLSNEILKGTAPDVFFVLDEDFEYLADVGALQDLSVYSQTGIPLEKEIYYEAAYEAGRRKKILYALPYECSPEIMVVNTSILQAENIDMPGYDWTWQDCYDICRKVTGPRDNRSGYQFGISEYGWESCFYSNDVVLFSEDGDRCFLTDEKAGEAITFLDRLGGLTAKKTNVQPSFSDGNVLFQPMSYSAYNAYVRNPIHMGVGEDFVWKIHTMPAGPHGDNNSHLRTQLVAMNSHSSKKELAWEFMKTMTTSPEIQASIYLYSEGISVCREIRLPEDISLYFQDDHEEVLDLAMQHAVNRQRFRDKEDVCQQIGIAVSDILAGSGNIQMEQIIYNRRINSYLQQKK